MARPRPHAKSAREEVNRCLTCSPTSTAPRAASRTPSGTPGSSATRSAPCTRSPVRRPVRSSTFGPRHPSPSSCVRRARYRPGGWRIDSRGTGTPPGRWSDWAASLTSLTPRFERDPCRIRRASAMSRRASTTSLALLSNASSAVRSNLCVFPGGCVGVSPVLTHRSLLWSVSADTRGTTDRCVRANRPDSHLINSNLGLNKSRRTVT